MLVLIKFLEGEARTDPDSRESNQIARSSQPGMK